MAKEEKVSELAAEVERLSACLEKAGLAAFIKGGSPEDVAEHLHGVLDSYEKEIKRLNSELDCDEKVFIEQADELQRTKDALRLMTVDRDSRILEIQHLEAVNKPRT